MQVNKLNEFIMVHANDNEVSQDSGSFTDILDIFIDLLNDYIEDEENEENKDIE